MGAWTVGHNLAGYLPESDIQAFAEWSDAADSYRAMAEDYADTDDEMAWEAGEGEAGKYPEDGEYPAMLATVKAILSDPSFPLEDGKPYGMLVEDNRGRMISMWLDWSDDVEPDEDFDVSPLLPQSPQN